MIDTAALLSAVNLEALIGDKVKLQRVGAGELKGCCPMHNEKTPSFRVYTDEPHYHCFGCGAHGTAIDWVMFWEGAEFREACRILAERANLSYAAGIPTSSTCPDPYAGIRPDGEPRYMPQPGRELTAWNPKPRDNGKPKGWTKYRPTAVYPYRTAAGALIGVVLRVETVGPAGGKKITPWLEWSTWLTEPGNEATRRDRSEWCHTKPARPRPLYGLDLLGRQPNAGVILVEGEKCADHLRRFGFLAVTWSGGTNAYHLADWSPLAGRRALCWPDADPVGVDAMEWAACLAEEAGALKPRICYPEPDRPKSWDCADAIGWSRQHFVRWMRRRAENSETAIRHAAAA